MLGSKVMQAGTQITLALLLSGTTLVSQSQFMSAFAQPVPPPPTSPVGNQGFIPAGTQIPVTYEKAKKILVTPQETLSVTLTVPQELRDRNGTVLIPAGSKISGQIQPTAGGSWFVAQQLTFPQGQSYPLNATSQVVSRTQVVRRGANVGEILGGSAAGAGAAALISGITGDKRIGALEVLAGAGIGALAGWALPATGTLGGRSTNELVVIYPEQDLNLMLRSDLFLNSNFYRRDSNFSRRPNPLFSRLSDSFFGFRGR